MTWWRDRDRTRTLPLFLAWSPTLGEVKADAITLEAECAAEAAERWAESQDDITSEIEVAIRRLAPDGRTESETEIFVVEGEAGAAYSARRKEGVA